jgi:hypothetical protein
MELGGSHAGGSAPAPEHHRVYVRRFKRYGVDKRIRVVAGSKALNGRCNVLSEDGFGAVIAGNLPERAIVKIEFTMDTAGKRLLSMGAEVRYVNGFHYGFEFVAPTAAQKAMISDLFAECVQVG